MNLDYLTVIFLSFLGYFFFIKIANYFKFIDTPSDQNIHKNKTYTQYGFIFILIFSATLIYFYNFNKIEVLIKIIPRPYVFLFSLISLSILSLLDFKFKIHPFIRLLLQFSFVFLSLSTLRIPIFGNFIPYKVEILLISYFWVYIINSTNFIDGIDSSLNIITVSTIIATIVISNIIGFIFLKELNILLISFLCCMLPFIIFNFPRAKVFCGDSGSIPIGYVLGWLNLFIVSETDRVFVLILTSYLLVDVTLTLIKKCFKRKVPWSRDFDYFFLIPTKYLNKKHMFTLRYLLINQIILICLAILSLYYNQFVILFISIIPSLILINYFNSLKKSLK
tara:strand:+ start:62 stop:1069 length:1008 start_codon:yes stop_codon:yes gene_type:complete